MAYLIFHLGIKSYTFFIHLEDKLYWSTAVLKTYFRCHNDSYWPVMVSRSFPIGMALAPHLQGLHMVTHLFPFPYLPRFKLLGQELPWDGTSSAPNLK